MPYAKLEEKQLPSKFSSLLCSTAGEDLVARVPEFGPFVALARHLVGQGRRHKWTKISSVPAQFFGVPSRLQWQFEVGSIQMSRHSRRVGEIPLFLSKLGQTKGGVGKKYWPSPQPHSCTKGGKSMSVTGVDASTIAKSSLFVALFACQNVRTRRRKQKCVCLLMNNLVSGE